jgi:hypothetical protein
MNNSAISVISAFIKRLPAGVRVEVRSHRAPLPQQPPFDGRAEFDRIDFQDQTIGVLEGEPPLAIPFHQIGDIVRRRSMQTVAVNG